MPSAQERKDLHTVMLLVHWEVWKHRNAIVFDNATPAMNVVMNRIYEEGKAWLKAGKFRGNTDSFFLRLFRWANRE